MNRDGIQNEDSSKGIDSVKVNLILDTLVVQSDYTKSGGYYLFSDVRPDTYIVEFVNPDPAIYKYTLQNENGPYLDSDPDTTEGRTGKRN